MSNLSTVQERANQFRNTLTNPKVRDQIALALPQHIKPEHMLRVVMTTIQRNPGILNCTEHSVLAAVMQASQLGLEPDSNLGLCHLVPYGNQCQLIVGYKGYIELARRSGMLSNVRAHVVQAGDLFEYELGLEPKLRHIPMDMLAAAQEEKNREAFKALGGNIETIIAAYAVVNLKDKSQMFEVVTRSFVDRIKRMSKSSSRPDSPWKLWEDQMWKKTALRQVFKYVPLSPEDKLLVALERDERGFAIQGTELVPLDVDDPSAATGSAPIDTSGAPASAMDQFTQQQQQQTAAPPTVTTAPATETPAPAPAKRRGRRAAAAANAAVIVPPTPPADATPPAPDPAPAPETLAAQQPAPMAPPPPAGPPPPAPDPRQGNLFGGQPAQSTPPVQTSTEQPKEDSELENV